jgi:hypothetical protein
MSQNSGARANESSRHGRQIALDSSVLHAEKSLSSGLVVAGRIVKKRRAHMGVGKNGIEGLSAVDIFWKINEIKYV